MGGGAGATHDDGDAGPERVSDAEYWTEGFGKDGGGTTGTGRVRGAVPGTYREDAGMGGESAGPTPPGGKNRGKSGSIFSVPVATRSDQSLVDYHDVRGDDDEMLAECYDVRGDERVLGGSPNGVPSPSGVGRGGVVAGSTGQLGTPGSLRPVSGGHGVVSAGGVASRDAIAGDGPYHDSSRGRWISDLGRGNGGRGAGGHPRGGARWSTVEEHGTGPTFCGRQNSIHPVGVDSEPESGDVAMERAGERGDGGVAGLWGDAESTWGAGCASIQENYGGESSRSCGASGDSRDGSRGLGAQGAGPPGRFKDCVQISGYRDVPGRTGASGGHAGLSLGARSKVTGVSGVTVSGLYDVLAEAERSGGYVMCPVGAAGLGNAPSNGSVEDTGRDLPVPIVETVDVQGLLPWVSESDRWIVEAMSSWGVFVSSVIKEDVSVAGVVDARLVNVSAKRLRRMVELRYIRRIRVGSRVEGGVACAVMFVPKDEWFDRLIWNGIPLNAMCQRPPSVAFVPIHDMLRELGGADVVWALSYDFATWFIQLRVHPDVQRVFLVRCKDGSLWRITGVPMGFSWAPVLAQVVAETIVAETLRRVDDQRLRAFVYIDNVLLYFVGGLDMDFVEEVNRVFRSVCAEVGAVLKESAFVSGTSHDWLGIELVVGRRRAQLRKKFCEKVCELWGMLRGEDDAELRMWWRMCALVIRSMWVTARPLAGIGDVMSWLSRNAKRLAAKEIGWSTRVPLWSLARRQVEAVVDWVRVGGVFRIVIPESRILACGVSDAASGNGAQGFVFRIGRRLRVVRIANDDASIHINILEFRAAVKGLAEVSRAVVGSGWIVWGSDSTVAMGWIRLGWSPDQQRNGMLRGMYDDVHRGDDRDVRLMKVPGGSENLADVLTRNGGGMLARGRSWCRDVQLMCDCRGVCAHALAKLWALVGVGPVLEAMVFP